MSATAASSSSSAPAMITVLGLAILEPSLGQTQTVAEPPKPTVAIRGVEPADGVAPDSPCSSNWLMRLDSFGRT